jgi:hypothetical protein
MKDETLEKKLNRATLLAKQHKRLIAQIREELQRRTGGDYNELDCDYLIDSLESGEGFVTLKDALSEISDSMKRHGRGTKTK